jgi:hypothetical protein
MEAKSWSKMTCLVLIDIQTDFWSGNAGIQAAFPRFPEQISALLGACRGAGIEVCHVLERANAHDSPWHSFWSEMNPDRVTDSSGAEEEWAAALQGERQFYKHAYDAVGVDCGLETHLRQASTARCRCFALFLLAPQHTQPRFMLQPLTPAPSAASAPSSWPVCSLPAACFSPPAPSSPVVSGLSRCDPPAITQTEQDFCAR